MSARSHPWVPLVALVAVACSLGTGHVCARLAFRNGVDITTAATARSVCATVLLFLVLRARGIPLLVPQAALRSVVLLGVLIAAQTVALQLAVKLMPVTLAILVFYTYPFFTGVVSSLLGAERVSFRLLGTLAAAFGGLALVLGVAPDRVNPLGICAALAASASFATVLILTPRLAPDLAAPLRTFLMLATAATIFVVAVAATHAFHPPQTGAGLAGLAGLALFYAAGIIGLFLVLPMLGPTQTAVVLNLEPVAVALVAWAALGESLTATQAAGAVIVVAAVIYFQVGARRRR
jgi:probable blue pigment (indigoidine) exporter